MILYYFIVSIFILITIFVLYNKTRKKFVVCLMYHNVFNEITNDVISRDEFEKHMEKIQNLKSFKMEELAKMKFNLPENSILVTFDDGYKNNYTEVFPILKKYGIKATIFINTKYIEKDEDYLKWNQIREMYESGLVDFQMHTHSHGLTIRTPEIKGFFLETENKIIKREYFSLFVKDEKKDFKTFKFEKLTIFKIRSQIAISGYKLKNNFLEKYNELNKKWENLSDDKRKDKWNKEFRKNFKEYFEKVSKKEFLEKVEFEIKENKRIIEEKLNKKVEFLAYPWGHRYSGRKSKLEEFGAKYFVLTSEKANKQKINCKKIRRINGDVIKEIELFNKTINRYYKK